MPKILSRQELLENVEILFKFGPDHFVPRILTLPLSPIMNEPVLLHLAEIAAFYRFEPVTGHWQNHQLLQL